MNSNVNFKRRGIWRVLFILMVVLQAFEIVFGLRYFNNTYNKDLFLYLLNNRSVDLKILNTEDYDVFFTGECHATCKNYDVQLRFIKYLSEKADLKYIFAEDFPSSSYIINFYLQTGDNSELEEYLKNLKGTYGGTNEFREYLVKLYEFNKSLPEDKKLTYIGLDIEHQEENAKNYLLKLTEKSSKLRSKIFSSSDELLSIEILRNISEDIKLNSDFYKKELGDNLFKFEYLLGNFIKGWDYCNSSENGLESDVMRENSIIENFKKVYNYFPKGKFYGQWGNSHAALSDSVEKKSVRFAAQLQNSKDSPVKGRVCSTMILYLNSQRMNRGNGSSEELFFPITDTKKELSTIKLLSKGDFTFFKLDGGKSPFKSQLYFFFPAEVGNVLTTDVCQYIILLRNSSACTQINT